MPNAALDTLSHPGLLKPSYVQSGRRYWEASDPETLIEMFEAGGYAVAAGSCATERVVRGRMGEVALILWHVNVPNFAYARTFVDWAIHT